MSMEPRRIWAHGDWRKRAAEAKVARLRIKTIHRGIRLTIVIARPGEAEYGTQEFCGESWCRGTCGHPALFLAYQGRQLKAHSDMTACGPVWQDKDKLWEGERIAYEPGPTEELAVLAKMMWW